jgi:hypothetical protein
MEGKVELAIPSLLMGRQLTTRSVGSYSLLFFCGVAMGAGIFWGRHHFEDPSTTSFSLSKF